MEWALFFSAFGLIFIAELPDKTALATLSMATRSRPWPVFIGVAAAFFIQCLVAVSFGKVFALLPEHWVHLGAGVMFLAFAAHAWLSKDSAEEEGEASTSKQQSKSFWPTLRSSFLVVFIAEWGDLTQLATASLAARYPQALFTVFLAAVLALWSVTTVAVLIGNRLKDFAKSDTLHRISTVLFALIGLYFLYLG